MRRNYKFMSDEAGFIFPFTLITITIIFLVLITLTTQFKNELVMTDNLQNQFIIESLFSLALNKKKSNIYKDTPFPSKKTYHFPQGQVTISYTIFDKYLWTQFLISTNDEKEYVLYQSNMWDESVEMDKKESTHLQLK